MKKRTIHVNIESLSLPEPLHGAGAIDGLREAIARDVEARMLNPSLDRAAPGTLAERIGKAVHQALQQSNTGKP
jgi:hypothetical protein